MISSEPALLFARRLAHRLARFLEVLAGDLELEGDARLAYSQPARAKARSVIRMGFFMETIVPIRGYVTLTQPDG